jgi:hypothetical protein
VGADVPGEGARHDDVGLEAELVERDGDTLLGWRGAGDRA